ncbi:MAG: VOC family protein [Acidobacteriaceae bacterium]
MAAVTGPATFKDICIDAVDHQRLATWWREVLGYERAHPAGQRPPGWPVAISDPAGCGPLIWVNPVPEPKVVKNRMHIDVRADPEGNEFCVFKA